MNTSALSSTLSSFCPGTGTQPLDESTVIVLLPVTQERAVAETGALIASSPRPASMPVAVIKLRMASILSSSSEAVCDPVPERLEPLREGQEKQVACQAPKDLIRQEKEPESDTPLQGAVRSSDGKQRG